MPDDDSPEYVEDEKPKYGTNQYTREMLTARAEKMSRTQRTRYYMWRSKRERESWVKMATAACTAPRLLYCAVVLLQGLVPVADAHDRYKVKLAAAQAAAANGGVAPVAAVPVVAAKPKVEDPGPDVRASKRISAKR